MKLNYGLKGLSFQAADLQEAMTISECFQAENVSQDRHSWHYLLTRDQRNVKELPAVDNLRLWGIDPRDGLENIQHVLDSKRKRYKWDTTPLEEIKHTPAYKRALELVTTRFGKPMKDGRVLFPYQIETAAMMIAKKRLLLALDMGLGKTVTTLVGLLADPSNRKVLIITMSRNINDWVREIDALGFENEFIVLNNSTDLHSDKRIHVVSYEKWSTDRVTFVKKPRMECPDCGSRHSRIWKQTLGYCYVCKTKHDKLLEDRWAEDDLPKECPCCKRDWEGHYACECGYSVVESRREPLYKSYHNGYSACAIDEGHYIKNGTSKRALAVKRVNTKKRYLLSGTPAENGADDLYWLLGWLTGFNSRFEDPIEARGGNYKPFQCFGKVGEEHFREYYSGGKKRRVLDIDSVEPRASHHEQLWEMLDSIMIRMRKTDKGVAEHIEVPKPEHHRMHLTLHDAERELYDKILTNFREWYEIEQARKEAAEARGDKYRISTIEICAWMDKLRKAASSPWQFETYNASKGTTTAKLEYLKNKAKDLLRRGKKMLVFSGHKETVEQLGILMDGVVPGKQAAYIHGGVKMEYRWELMKKFQDPNDPLSILIMSHRTGAESYTLTEAKSVFLFDLDFNAKVRPEVA
ncbi:SNF2-related protein [Paenibacillus aestuarii]|uniref:SNF2-related protein n=1 Tax=Paenibacillus aestuarii TaxID=516965 RepID=A0ABW0KBF1_9BACL